MPKTDGRAPIIGRDDTVDEVAVATLEWVIALKARRLAAIEAAIDPPRTERSCT